MKIKLRAWREDDASKLYDIYRVTPDLVYQMPALNCVEDARTLICEELLPSSGHIPWCLEADNQAAGCVGIRCMGRQPSGTWDRAWVYYWISAETRGLGITS
ncbi:MAG: GNAT family N-acetyltransferase, partial [Rothia dentocariosa]